MRAGITAGSAAAAAASGAGTPGSGVGAGAACVCVFGFACVCVCVCVCVYVSVRACAYNARTHAHKPHWGRVVVEEECGAGERRWWAQCVTAQTRGPGRGGSERERKRERERERERERDTSPSLSDNVPRRRRWAHAHESSERPHGQKGGWGGRAGGGFRVVLRSLSLQSTEPLTRTQGLYGATECDYVVHYEERVAAVVLSGWVEWVAMVVLIRDGVGRWSGWRW